MRQRLLDRGGVHQGRELQHDGARQWDVVLVRLRLAGDDGGMADRHECQARFLFHTLPARIRHAGLDGGHEVGLQRQPLLGREDQGVGVPAERALHARIDPEGGLRAGVVDAFREDDLDAGGGQRHVVIGRQVVGQAEALDPGRTAVDGRGDEEDAAQHHQADGKRDEAADDRAARHRGLAPAKAGRKELKLVPILGDRAPGDGDALVPEAVGDLLVGERVARHLPPRSSCGSGPSRPARR